MDTHFVLVPLDGSITAEVILPYAEAAARALNAELRLFSAVDTSHSTVVTEPADRAADSPLASDQAAVGYLQRHAEAAQERGVRAMALTAAGDPIDQIVAAAEQPGVVLVAMATHGQSGIKRWYLGGVADGVLRTTTKSVLLVDPEHSAGAARPVVLERIVVPLDGSELAEAALPMADQLAHSGGGKVTLVQVLPQTGDPEGAGFERIGAQTESEAHTYLEMARLKVHDAAQVTTLVLRGTPSAAIEKHLLAIPADLLVITTHGRGGRKHLVLGSTAYRLLHAGPSVLLVRSSLR